MEARGTLRQNFKLTVNVCDLQEFICEKIEESIREENGIDLDYLQVDEIYGEEMFLSGRYSCDYKSTWYRATQECPEEFDIEREYLGDDGSGFLNKLPEEIRKLVNITSVDEPEDGIEDMED